MTAAKGNADIASQTPAEGEVPQSVPYLPRWKGGRIWEGTHSQLRVGLGRHVCKDIGVLFRVNDSMPSQVQGKAAAAVWWFLFPRIMSTVNCQSDSHQQPRI